MREKNRHPERSDGSDVKSEKILRSAQDDRVGSFVQGQAHMGITRRPLHGFTLVELLVVITIIGILIALCCRQCSAREAAKRMQCATTSSRSAWGC